MICSNDRYEDHCTGAPGGGGKDLRRWLRRNRRGYEFRVGSPIGRILRGGPAPVARFPPRGMRAPPTPAAGTRARGRAGRSGTMVGRTATVSSKGASAAGGGRRFTRLGAAGRGGSVSGGDGTAGGVGSGGGGVWGEARGGSDRRRTRSRTFRSGRCRTITSRSSLR